MISVLEDYKVKHTCIVSVWLIRVKRHCVGPGGIQQRAALKRTGICFQLCQRPELTVIPGPRCVQAVIFPA